MLYCKCHNYVNQNVNWGHTSSSPAIAPAAETHTG